MKHSAVTKKFLAFTVAVAMTVAMVPAVGAVAGIFGTVQATGQAWVASDASDWSVRIRKIRSSSPARLL